MTQDASDLIVKMLEMQGQKIENLEKKVDELVALKNKLIAGGIVLSAIFAYVFDWFKALFGKN